MGRAVAALYVGSVAGAAAYGFVADAEPAIAVAVLLSLPSSIPCLVGFYVAYGLLAQVPGANPDESSGAGGCSADRVCHSEVTGELAPWFAFATDVLGVLTLTAAAALNVLVIRRILRGR